METGKVIWFDGTKGYGFIKRDNGVGDIFVHHTAIQVDGFKKLEQGQTVSFDIDLSPRGPVAKNVNIVWESEENE